MPRFDLRIDENTLDPIAHFKVLAKMCHPNDTPKYQRMMAGIQKGTGVGGFPRSAPQSVGEFHSEVRDSALKAGPAAGLLTTRQQIHFHEHPAYSNNPALPLVQAQILHGQLPGYAKRNQRDRKNLRQMPVGEGSLRAAYDHFFSVLHLWAAMLHDIQQKSVDDAGEPLQPVLPLWSWSIETLPKFLACADRVLELACKLPHPNRPQRYAMTDREAWIFLLPKRLIQREKFVPRQLVPLQKRALRQREESP